MLQEATKILNTAFSNSFTKRLAMYLHDCIREEVKSSTFRNLNQDKDNKWYFIEDEEKLLASKENLLELDGSNSTITELMIHAETSKKERYLIYGHLFLTGKNNHRKKSNEYLTPLLYSPCRLEREGMTINCSLSEETLSLNTGALASLIRHDDEDEVEHLFEGLIDVVPELPITQEKIQIFLTTLQSIIPDISLEGFEFEEKKVNEDIVDFFEEDKPSGVNIENKSAIILTKRPSVTAGVLHELTQIAEKPSGEFRETALNIINQEYSKVIKGNKSIPNPSQNFVPIVPLDISDSQNNTIKAIEQNDLVSVYGPPGTGKSQTIVNLVSHLVANGKTVLVASRMDKAVDVVSKRLNTLGAPFLSLRAGRTDYQKQLNFKLQDLLSNKVDLDSGFENSFLVNIEDMHKLRDKSCELQENAEKIIAKEHKWYETLQDHKKLNKKITETLIEKDLSDAEIKAIANRLDSIKEKQETTNFIVSLIKKYQEYKLNKTLEFNEFDYSYENIEKLLQELDLQTITNKLKGIESSIHKIGNLHQTIENIRLLKKKKKYLAIDILKSQRRESLKDILRDELKRRRLIVHSKALVERKKNLQNRLLDSEDFQPLLEAFPCWAVTTYAISEALPLKPGLFDVVIIDEASQCDIASCFPVLYRAKKAVIVGDDKQLPHLSFLEKTKEQSFLSQYDIPDKYQLMWRFRTNSMFDLANYYALSPVLLDEHFRSKPPIINFSNKEFYGDRIRVMNKDLEKEQCLELHVVENAKVDLDTTRNMAEAEKIVADIQDFIIKDNKENPDNPSSIGVISPFRGQVELLKKAVAQVFNEKIIKKHSLEIGTAHTFQGDEKDIIFLSWTLASNSHIQSLTFLQKPNLFNVAITRAKKYIKSYISRPVNTLPKGLLKSYLEYIDNHQAYFNVDENDRIELDENTYNNALEKDIAKYAQKEGFEVVAGLESAGFNIDLVVINNDKAIAVECDGLEDKDQKQTKQIWKQFILERCGWKVIRITAREWHYSKKVCIDRIKQELENDNEI